MERNTAPVILGCFVSFKENTFKRLMLYEKILTQGPFSISYAMIELTHGLIFKKVTPHIEKEEDSHDSGSKRSQRTKTRSLRK